ncbi:MAG: lysophospholipid acyltransferase family protein [Kiritimatiellae bacterium]|nr:lysophospholipid acyltransferase family protein [Kiritimatiellia bacterium]
MTFIQRKAYGFGCGLAAMLWPFFVRRRRISVENILKCGVAADAAAAKRIAARAFRHFAGHVCEALCAPGVVGKDNYREHLDFADASPAAVKTLLDSPETPILLVSGHHGCWEVATNIISLARPMIAIARVMDSKILQRWMKKHHFRGPVTVISKNDGFTRDIIAKWREERSAMTILMDQYSYGGPLLTFLGRPARTVTSAARLAIRYGFPVVVGSFVRIAPYRYRLVGGDPLTFGRDDDRDRVTQILNDRLSDAIRKYPEQYLWMHRRWRDD